MASSGGWIAWALVAAGAQAQPIEQPDAALDRIGGENGGDAGRVAQHIVEAFERLLGIERHRHEAGAHRAEEALDIFAAIADQKADALARTEPESLQGMGKALHAIVERPIVENPLPLSPEIDQSRAVRRRLNDIAKEIP